MTKKIFAGLVAFALLVLLGVLLYRAPQPNVARSAAKWKVYAGDPVAAPVALVEPRGVAVGADNTIYFTDGGAVRVLRADGSLSILAGDPSQNAQFDAQGTAARFNRPGGLALASDGTLFVADTGNNVIRAIAPDGRTRTVPARSRFNMPVGVALDAQGDLLVADTGSLAVRKLALASGVVSTVRARIAVPLEKPYVMRPQGLAFDASGALVVNDEDHAVRLLPNGGVALLSPQPVAEAPDYPAQQCKPVSCLGRKPGPVRLLEPVAPPARFPFYAVNVAADQQGNLVVARPYPAGLFRLAPSGMYTPLLGAFGAPANVAGAARDREGRFYFVSRRDGDVRLWDKAGVRQPFALRTEASANRDGPREDARVADPTRLAFGRDGALYVLDGDQLRRIDKEGVIRTLHEQGGFRRLRSMQAAQLEPRSSLVARPSTGVFGIARGGLVGVSAEGHIAFVSGPPGVQVDDTGVMPVLRRLWGFVAQDAVPFVFPGIESHSMGADASGQAYYCTGKTLWRIRPRGTARSLELQGVVDGCDDVLVAPNDDIYILHGQYITRLGTDGQQALLAGHRKQKGQKDGAGLLARFEDLRGGVFDSAGNLYLVDGATLRKLSTDGAVSTEIGVEGKRHGRLLDLPPQIGALRAVAIDRKGAIYLAAEGRILRVQQAP